ncbi:MAG: hypothetical protein NVSMB60_18660 [Mycobacterium sp.]
MTPIESKHDVRRKVRDAQAQVNRERLKRESDNREDMVAFLVADRSSARSASGKQNGTRKSGWKPNNAARSNAWKVRARWRGCVIAARPWLTSPSSAAAA